MARTLVFSAAREAATFFLLDFSAFTVAVDLAFWTRILLRSDWVLRTIPSVTFGFFDFDGDAVVAFFDFDEVVAGVFTP